MYLNLSVISTFRRNKILAIEEQLDCASFIYRGENVWPVIRMAIYLGEKKPLSFKRSQLKDIVPFALKGAVGWLKHTFAGIGQKSDNLLVTTSHYKVAEHGVTYDRVLNPVIEYLQELGERFQVWEYTSYYKYHPNLSYKQNIRKIQREVYFQGLSSKLFRKTGGIDKLQGDVGQLNELLEFHGLKFRLNDRFTQKLDAIFKHAEYYGRQLARCGVKRVFLVCYYDVKCFSILLAAHRLGLKTIDIQHGIQGPHHMAYASWRDSMTKNNKFLPSYFYVWDPLSKKTIQEWFSHREHVLQGYNKWFLDRCVKKSDDVILVSLHRTAELIPPRVIQLIREYKGEKKWYIRAHPRQLDEIDEIEALLKTEGLFDQVNLHEASTMPLTAVLERCALHVTVYSTVALEAAYYNIPTYFVDSENVQFFVGYLNKNMIFLFDEISFDQALDAAADLQNHTVATDKQKLTVLDEFIK